MKKIKAAYLALFLSVTVGSVVSFPLKFAAKVASRYGFIDAATVSFVWICASIVCNIVVFVAMYRFLRKENDDVKLENDLTE